MQNNNFQYMYETCKRYVNCKDENGNDCPYKKEQQDVNGFNMICMTGKESR